MSTQTPDDKTHAAENLSGETAFPSAPTAESGEPCLPDSVLQTRAIELMRTVYDPEIPVNIYDLGLIYSLKIFPDARRAEIRMTLTAPSCPMAQELPERVANAVALLPELDEVDVAVVWDPPWNQQMMNEAARLQLGLV